MRVKLTVFFFLFVFSCKHKEDSDLAGSIKIERTSKLTGETFSGKLQSLSTPVCFDPTAKIDSNQKSVIKLELEKYYHQYTNLRFPIVNDCSLIKQGLQYVRIYSGVSVSTTRPVGLNMEVLLNIDRPIGQNVVHEFLHVAGFVHDFRHKDLGCIINTKDNTCDKNIITIGVDSNDAGVMRDNMTDFRHPTDFFTLAHYYGWPENSEFRRYMNGFTVDKISRYIPKVFPINFPAEFRTSTKGSPMGDLILWIQMKLNFADVVLEETNENYRGHNMIYDDAMRSAIKSYQKKYKLNPVSGEIDQKTWDHLTKN